MFSDPPGIAHDSLPLVSRACPSGELSGVLDRFASATPSLSFGGRPSLRWNEWTGFFDGTTGLTLPAGCFALAPRRRPTGQPVGL